MRKWSIIGVLAVGICILFLFLPHRPDPAPESKSGWTYTESGAVYYLDEEGLALTGWQTVDGIRYYFDPAQQGARVTGWLELPEGKYYFDPMGALQTGWLLFAGEEYYLRSDGSMARGQVTIDGKNYFFTSSGKPFVLVNRWNPVPEAFEPDLVELEGFRVAAECAAPLKAMMEGCRAAGHRCVINSAYRDISFQQMLWDNRYNSYISQGYSHQEATDLSAAIVLPPGTSEHHLGLAIDITGTDEMYRWLAEHAPEYGFILRYPKDKIQVTGVSYEPWHFRYVGMELAAELQSLGLTPEEYIGMLTPVS